MTIVYCLPYLLSFWFFSPKELDTWWSTVEAALWTSRSTRSSRGMEPWRKSIGQREDRLAQSVRHQAQKSDMAYGPLYTFKVMGHENDTDHTRKLLLDFSLFERLSQGMERYIGVPRNFSSKFKPMASAYSLFGSKVTRLGKGKGIQGFGHHIPTFHWNLRLL